MQIERKWYALYTKPRWEKKVSDLLSRKKLENYCPLNKIVRQWSDRRKTILEPLFTSYVFVQLAPDELVMAKRTEGVYDFVYWLGRIAVIKDEEILAIKDFLAIHNRVHLERINISINDNVRIIKGPLTMIEGQVTEINSRTVKVCLPTLGYMMTAEIEKSNVELVGNSRYKNSKAS